MRVPRCDPRTGREPPKSGPSPPPPGRLYRALIKSIKSEPVHHCRATDTKLHILLCSSRMLTTRPNEACNERAEQRPQPGPHTPRLTPPSARQPPWHLWCRGRARFRRRRRQRLPIPPSRPLHRHPHRASSLDVDLEVDVESGRRARSTERMVMTPPRGAHERQPSPQRVTAAHARTGRRARRRLALR